MPSEIECACGHLTRVPDDWDSPAMTCLNCGNKLSLDGDADESVVAERQCPVCGKKLLPQENWCTQCKAPVDLLEKVRSDPVAASQSGLCPACGKKRLPNESACPYCQVVVADYLEQLATDKNSTRCRTCGTRLLPKETACPKCQTLV